MIHTVVLPCTTDELQVAMCEMKSLGSRRPGCFDAAEGFLKMRLTFLKPSLNQATAAFQDMKERDLLTSPNYETLAFEFLLVSIKRAIRDVVTEHHIGNLPAWTLVTKITPECLPYFQFRFVTADLA